MVWSGATTHSSKLHAPLRLEVPRTAPHKIFLVKSTCVAQAHTTEKLTRSNGLAKSSTSVIAPWYFSSRSVVESFFLRRLGGCSATCNVT